MKCDNRCKTNKVKYFILYFLFSWFNMFVSKGLLNSLIESDIYNFIILGLTILPTCVFALRVVKIDYPTCRKCLK